MNSIYVFNGWDTEEDRDKVKYILYKPDDVEYVDKEYPPETKPSSKKFKNNIKRRIN